ncbi:CGCGG family putative rSAM-modified RiPP protein [Halobaculum sp. EA56]|uniref:CGCGG family putative rSAM-modified RiPP protein n=1 Tax=Halobaculum sp. EA56 TaxID=3421648 RepID=UPI003EBECC39
MSSTPHDHDHDAEPVTDRVHDNSWSANLEKPEHGKDRELILQQAIDAVEHTADGNHVNLVTHENHGHPSEYLFPGLCSFGTRRLISRVSDAPAEVVDGRFQQHFTELKPPASRTHGYAERALDA